jgi:hypothetical protein
MNIWWTLVQTVIRYGLDGLTEKVGQLPLTSFVVEGCFLLLCFQDLEYGAISKSMISIPRPYRFGYIAYKFPLKLLGYPQDAADDGDCVSLSLGRRRKRFMARWKTKCRYIIELSTY